MSGKMKKLICAILSGTMILSSASMLAFAAPEDTDTNNAEVTETMAPEADATEAADAEATEAPEAEATEATEAPTEATEAPAAAAAPAATTTKYDGDEYYKKALALCKGLGIITGREDGNVDPEANVTRAEMAAIILRMLNNTTTSSYRDAYTDVTSAHWAAGIIQTASALGIINGYPEDKSFRPDNSVQYEQIAKMIVCAMNYHETAAYYGGYPTGHLKVAADLNLTKNAPGVTGVASERGVVIKMIYNALLADYNEPSGIDYGQQQYKAEKTLAEYAFDVKEAKGILLGTEVTSLTGAKYNKGQVRIRVNKSGNESEEETFLTELTGLEDILASNITFYYEEQAGNAEKILLAVTENTAKTKTENIDRKAVENLDEFSGFESGNAVIKLHGKSAFKISSDPLIIYNGSLATSAAFDAAQAVASKEDVRFYDGDNAKTFSEFLKPEVGTIKLVDNDTDGVYDIVFVDAYETMLVTSASTKSVIGKIGNKKATINVNEDEKDLSIKTTISGMEAAPRNLKKNSVVSVKRSLDGETLEFVSTGESFTGAIQSRSDDNGVTTITVGGTEYDVDVNAQADCKTGVQAIFFTDIFNRVGYVESSSGSRLQAGEKYGWLMSAYDSVNGEDLVVKIMTQEGKAEEFKLAKTVSYWAPAATASESLQKSAAENKITNLLKNDEFTHMWKIERQGKAGVIPGTNDKPSECTKSYSIRFVKYKANSNGEISKLYTAVNVVNAAEHFYNASSPYVYNGKYITDPYIPEADIQKIKNSDALIFDMNSKAGSTLVSGLVGGYVVTDDMLEFKVPDKTEDYNKASAYKIGNVTASSYNLRENGVADTFIFADMDGSSASAIIRFVADTTVPGNPADMDNVGNTSSMIVSSIAKGLDEDENRIYKISGYVSGSLITVTTNASSALAELTGYNDKKYATSDRIWMADGTSDVDKKATGLELTDFLHKGDIIISDGTNILRYANVKDIYEKVKAGESAAKTVQGSETRNYFYFDTLNSSEVDDPSWVSVGGRILSFDSSKAMSVVEIDLTKDFNDKSAVRVMEEANTIAELQEFDAETKNGDYVFARIANKGELQEMAVYRFIGE